MKVSAARRSLARRPVSSAREAGAKFRHHRARQLARPTQGKAAAGTGTQLPRRGRRESGAAGARAPAGRCRSCPLRQANWPGQPRRLLLGTPRASAPSQDAPSSAEARAPPARPRRGRSAPRPPARPGTSGSNLAAKRLDAGLGCCAVASPLSAAMRICAEVSSLAVMSLARVVCRWSEPAAPCPDSRAASGPSLVIVSTVCHQEADDEASLIG